MHRDTNKLGPHLASLRGFQIGPPRDPESVVRLFTLLLNLADEQFSLGKSFGLPFAALVKLAHCNRPSLEELDRFCKSRYADDAWPAPLRTACEASVDGAPEMFFQLLRLAIDSAQSYHVNGSELCRALAAVGQTLNARSLPCRQANRVMAAKYRKSPGVVTPPASPPREAADQSLQASAKLPKQVEFRRNDEQGGSLELNGITLWHASFVGPKIAEKSENQDATFAIVADFDSSSPGMIFALADGVSTSMGSRVAAHAIVRRFCEFALQGIRPNEPITGDDLIGAVRRLHATLDELAETLLQRPFGYVFDAVRGQDLNNKTALKILNNTLNVRTSAIPAALTATLIAGVARPTNDGAYKVDLLRIGDGNVEHISRGGEVSTILDTDPDVVAVTQALGPGPRSRTLFDSPDAKLETRVVTLGCGESLIISSDGLARGHHQSIAAKLSGLMAEDFWKTALPTQADAALEILHKASGLADELSSTDTGQFLFADNLSLILIRCND